MLPAHNLQTSVCHQNKALLPFPIIARTNRHNFRSSIRQRESNATFELRVYITWQNNKSYTYVQIIKYVGVSLFSPQTILLPFAQEQRVQRKKRIFYSERVTHMESFLYFHANQRITIAGGVQRGGEHQRPSARRPGTLNMHPAYYIFGYCIYCTGNVLPQGPASIKVYSVYSRPPFHNGELIESLQIYLS